MDKILLYISLLFPLLYLYVLIKVFIRSLISRKRTKREAEILEKTNETYPTDSVSAKIISKRTNQNQVLDYKYFRMQNRYFVTFRTKENKEIELEVNKEFYERCVPNMEGTLLTVNGKFFDFGDGEPV